MKKIKFKAVICLVFSLLTIQVVAQGNLIVNGGFEQGFTNWTIQNGPNGISSIGPIAFVPPTVPNEGNVYAEFYQEADQGSGSGAAAQTIFPVTPGAYYALSFSALSIEGTNSLKVSVENSLLATLNFEYPILYGYNPPFSQFVFNTNWQSFSYVFQATTISPTISFNFNTQVLGVIHPGQSTEIYYGAVGLDNVSVIQIVPEPGTLALAGVGLILGLACRRLVRGKPRKSL